MNMLADKGPSMGIIAAVTLNGERFEDRRVPVYADWRELRDWALRTIENDPYLGDVAAIIPGSRRMIAAYRRDPIRAL